MSTDAQFFFVQTLTDADSLFCCMEINGYHTVIYVFFYWDIKGVSVED